MWLIVYEGLIYNKLKTVDEVANLGFRLTNDWKFCSYLRDYLADKEIDFEEDFEDKLFYVFKYR